MNTQTSRISQDETGLGSLSCVHGADRLAYAPYALGWDVCSVCRRAYPRAACPTPPCRPFQEGGDIASPGYMSRASVSERAGGGAEVMLSRLRSTVHPSNAGLLSRLSSQATRSTAAIASRRVLYSRWHAASAATGSLAAVIGIGAGGSHLLLQQQQQQQRALTTPARYDALMIPQDNLVRSVASMSQDEGGSYPLPSFSGARLLFTLTPMLATFPLFKTPLRAYWLRLLVATLERCGPVGIKWGQWASTRYDIFEDDLCDALGALTNAAPVHARSWTDQVVRDELGQSIEALFDDFSVDPIASGSIGQVRAEHTHGSSRILLHSLGSLTHFLVPTWRLLGPQVHTARLKAAHGPFPEGTKVAVKVQHPGLAQRLGIDMAILMSSADALGSIKGVTINETVAQFASNFYQQLDFRDEAENLRRFGRHFGSSFWRAIVSFPKPVDDLVSQHVVVETFETGESVADYLHKAGDSPKVTKWKQRGSWVPVDESLSVEAVAKVAMTSS